jgi:hypothetical protein
LNKKAKNKKLRKVESKMKKKRGYDNPFLAQARKRDDWPEWEKAMDAEYNQMIDDGVFDEHERKLPPDANLIGSMMTLTIKRNQDGSIDKYKARLVCLGNQQEESSYDAIKSGTARSATVKLMISIQAKLGCSSMVLDVKGAYLKSKIREELNEKLFIMLPDKSVVRLKKYLYGLKQAGYEWEQNVTKCLIRGGYDQSEADPRSFSKWDGDRFAIMCIHVDDFFVIGSDDEADQNLVMSSLKFIENKSCQFFFHSAILIDENSNQLQGRFNSHFDANSCYFYHKTGGFIFANRSVIEKMIPFYNCSYF